MNSFGQILVGSALMLGLASGAQAQCVGNCGVSGADGDVTISPLGGIYNYISTSGGVAGVGSLGVSGEVNGSQFTTGNFSALAGSQLTFFFNYVTSDGAGFSDYAWSQLQTISGTSVATLFSARTVASGDTVPGFGLPPLAATLTPGSTPIQLGTGANGGPLWSPLGASSGTCFSGGCGFTGWIRADYTIANAGDYRLAFGVTNVQDTSFDSGLAFAGVSVDDVPVIPGVPEPTAWAMLIAGFGLVGAAARRRREIVLA